MSLFDPTEEIEKILKNFLDQLNTLLAANIDKVDGLVKSKKIVITIEDK